MNHQEQDGEARVDFESQRPRRALSPPGDSSASTGGELAVSALFDFSVVADDRAVLQELIVSGAVSDVADVKSMLDTTPRLCVQGTEVAEHLLQVEYDDLYVRERAPVDELLLFAVACATFGVRTRSSILIERGDLSVNSRDNIQRTPLFAAVCYDLAEVVEVLIKAGVDVNTTDRTGRTAIFDISWTGGVSGLQVLLPLGAFVDVVSVDMETPMHIAAKIEAVKAAQLLTDYGVLIDEPTRTYSTLLLIAACLGHHKMVQFLLNAGVSVHSDSSLQHLPLG